MTEFAGPFMIFDIVENGVDFWYRQSEDGPRCAYGQLTGFRDEKERGGRDILTTPGPSLASREALKSCPQFSDILQGCAELKFC